MQKLIRLLAALAAALTLSLPASGADITATGSGWINAGGGDNSGGTFSGINNHFTGFEGQAFNNWFMFDLPNYAITSATLRIWNESANSTIDPNALYTLHEATSFSFAGLSGGPVLGSITLGVTDSGVSQYVDIALNSFGLAALNANLGSSFVFGGTITSIVDPSGCYDCVAAFGYNGGVPEAMLSLNTAPVPEPEIYAMLAAGLGLMGFATRRRKQQNKSA